ncbi:TlpA disulfide reductase family protein [Aequorivita sp. SDUM287046]|uniref:TlpA disulfide reductase family protein n=1 Tax=Aequorivita aurantiaca TaxID=3053356 RepID=A0ABT8DHM3_9FLAO|nr:TlpA disulfide reductase family protein [Aequorivita aurantiaca]MDN3724901.1 TlpA disulfide reductase family protein [Aequorivita aurantiaca]
MISFLKKNWSNILFFGFVALMLIPQTRMPLQVFVQRLISFSPTETAENDRKSLQDYEWSLHQLNSEQINFSRSQGNVAIVNFWATWCPPCVAEMPSFQKLYDKYGQKVDFYFITSEKSDKISAFMSKNGYSMPIYLQIEEAPQQLQSEALPTTFVISKKGKIVINEEGAADWNSKKIQSLLDELLEE